MKTVQRLEIVHTIDAVRSKVAAARRAGKKIGFVPTLGGLHDGHGALIEAARKECDYVVVSVFVNALQFGPNEDLQKYPRNLEADAAFCAGRGANLLFAPPHEEMYPREQRAFVEVEKLTDELCGRFRPGHFRGVTTVVTKLFNIVLPDIAYFGEKDGQQLRVVQRMVRDLNFPVTIRPVPTVREADGLAMSTRNTYLSPEERRAAAAIYRGLERARRAVEAGERSAAAVEEAVRAELRKEPLLREQYVEVVDVDELQPLHSIGEEALVAVAAFAGGTRLIDNVVVRAPQGQTKVLHS